MQPLLLLPRLVPRYRGTTSWRKGTWSEVEGTPDQQATLGCNTLPCAHRPTAHSPQLSLDCLGNLSPVGWRIRRPELPPLPLPYQLCDHGAVLILSFLISKM